MAAWLFLGVLASSPTAGLAEPWLWISLFLGFLVVVDLLLMPMKCPVTVEREVPGRFALGVETEVVLAIKAIAGGSRGIEVFDELPPSGISRAMPWAGQVAEGRTTKVSYQVAMQERGDVEFGLTQVQITSGLGLWGRRFIIGEPSHSKVYPNYVPVIQFALLAMDNHIEQMGIISKSRVGLSREFHQLRDYHVGDTLSQIDWKATARRCQMIAKDYQEQRDQTLILMVDRGRRMRAVDGEFTQFDHCLNAILLLSYVALRQGDHVGILGFGGEESWLAPVKGGHSMSTILNHLYQFKTSPEPSDYEEAAKTLLARQRRRAMVVMMTNLRGEDKTELVEPLRMIRTKHLVSVGSLREESVDEILNCPIENSDDALTFGAAQLYIEERRVVRQVLKDHGIPSVDATAKKFPIELANHYLEIKASGLL